MTRLAQLATFVLLFGVTTTASLRAQSYPELRDGDLIFQTSKSNQSAAILIASSSPYSHVGIIKHKKRNVFVVEASNVVKETTLESWIERGLFRRYAIYRFTGLTSEKAQEILQAAATYYKRPYDIFFSFDNNSMYCSELVYVAYKTAGLQTGKLQKVSELHTQNSIVKKIIEQRWQRHPKCMTKGMTFDQCYDRVLSDILVTPASLAEDSQFEKVYSNYPGF